ncbi:ATP-binding protein [Nitrospirillum amazonense]|uniref:Putative ATPase n=1 Tax=Nitrospirillum amazonense TaxID=28077 RepID=A0A560K2V5_9PROT|nr:winged helix-turn-helix domain-containing protein [Nitrospirillum amazonense]MDG3444113.1 winged helix-turn-helix domain-containing protein [Nitrospirillum amazonense]TWB77668.1 putative ATPase [Nitrospirillum amazonense]
MPEQATTKPSAEAVYRFGPYSLYPARRLLTAGQPIDLRGRALDLLLALVERAGEVLDRAELESRVWPGLHVGENNLRVQMGKLRRALGQDGDDGPYVGTVPGQGYRFVAQVLKEGAGPAPPTSPAMAAFALSRQMAPPLGRDETIATLAASLGRQRLITIVGAGGMGKTTVALAVAAAVAGRYPDGVALIDLSAVGEGGLVETAVAARLAPHIHAANPMPALLAFLKPRRMLLVLDSCEPVIAAAAALADALLAGAPGLDILATSREPLGLEREHVHRLAPLVVPMRSEGLSASQALAHSAVQLFMARAAAGAGGGALTDAEAPAAAEICQRLDGIPLGLELAAGQVAAYGITGVACRLDDRLGLLVRGRRTAPPRHQTLRAAFDWSYALLSGAQRAVLNRLSVFVGGFDAAAAMAVVSPADLDGEGTSGHIVDELVAKSLVVADRRGTEARYRLLDTVRTYAGEWLEASGGGAETRVAHAAHYLRLFQSILPEWATRPAGEMAHRYAVEIDNVRQALDWCFNHAGDEGVRVGRALVLAVAPLWQCLSLGMECHRWAALALGSPLPHADDRQSLDLQMLWVMAVTVMSIAPPDQVAALWEGVLATAGRLGDGDGRLQAQQGLYFCHLQQGRVRQALELVRGMRKDVAEGGDPSALALAERMVGGALYILGDPAEARHHTEMALSLAESGPATGRRIRFQMDQQIVARGALAGMLWLQGNIDQGMEQLRRCLEQAMALDHAYTTCVVLGQSACPLAMMTGDWAAAQRHNDLLTLLAERHGSLTWQPWARGFGLILRQRAGGTAEGLEELRRQMANIGDLSHARYGILVRETALALARAGDLEGGLAMVGAALARAEANEEGWAQPELMRLNGELLFQRGDKAAAEMLYRQALAVAERQGALSWHLRAAISLARSQARQGRVTDAPDLLVRAVGRVNGGRPTAEVDVARVLLGHFQGVPAPDHVLDGPAGPAGGLLAA